MMSAEDVEPDLKIRKIDNSEVNNVAELWHFTKKAAYPYLPLEQLRNLEEDELFFREQILSRCDVWAADDNGQIAGFLAIQGPYVDRLYVLPDSQLRGIGSRLIQHAKELSPDGLRLHTHRKNIPAWKFYEKHGFLAVISEPVRRLKASPMSNSVGVRIRRVSGRRVLRMPLALRRST